MIAISSLGVQVLGLWQNSHRDIVNEPLSSAEDGSASLSLRNEDFPRTYIQAIHVDVTSPNHWVHLVWTGPQATRLEQGPFRSSPGRGDGCNCNDFVESNRLNSYCTPKGEFTVKGFNDFLPSLPMCRFATWFHVEREIAIHSHNRLTTYPASAGCVRVSEYAAQLIHNNAINGRTLVNVDGTWSGTIAGWPSKETHTPSDTPNGLVTKTVIDSDMTREEALDGVAGDCPETLLNRLVVLDVEYYSFDNKLHRGQIVLDRALTKDIEAVFKVARDYQFPIESVIPVSDSKFRREGVWDDGLSMRANNSSAFNYRRTTDGRRLSAHALGRAVDINPMLNPYVNGNVIEPEGAGYDPSVPGTLEINSPLVRAFFALGWEWGGLWQNNKDYQHFEKR